VGTFWGHSGDQDRLIAAARLAGDPGGRRYRQLSECPLPFTSTAAEQDDLLEEIFSSDDRSLRDEELADLVDVEPSPARVTFTTQDLSIDGLVTRLNRKSMLVPQFGGQDELVQVPGFQRGFVGSRAQMDRFIES
jgi:hypothetical protein